MINRWNDFSFVTAIFSSYFWLNIILGVGPMTVAMLLHNTAESCKRFSTQQKVLKVCTTQ